MKKKSIALLVGAALLVIGGTFGHQRVTAFFWKAENATVRLPGCASNDCIEHGTIRMNPWNGMYYLTTAEGKVYELGEGATAMIQGAP
ncbi:hypothetical protein MW7_004590 [Imbroritus primus]|uniref:Uncharacterized protein n=1 Tax=Imbroritus primus TaxID=3058603 RepID=A0ACD3SS22_9BURK|nr:hypothetical protein MW7_004590 [Burkholderiaceae bacterium PBA]